jgi:hypothetical protein
MASKGTSALRGAATGAAAGAVLGPWGAAAGGVIGGVAGYFSGGDPKAPTYDPNHQNFQYGLGPSDSYASLQSGNYDKSQAGLQALGADAYNRGAPTQAMPDQINQVQSGGQGYLTDSGAAQQQQQLAGLNSQVGALNAFAGQPQGPSAAQAQLQTGTDMAAKQQFGFARAQPGGGGAALRNAAFNAAGISGGAANQAAMLKAQETQAYQQNRLSALNAAMGGAGTATGYAGQARGQTQGFQQAQAGQANYDAGSTNAFNQGQQTMQFNVGANNLSAAGQARGQNDALTLGTIGASQNYDTMRNGLASSQLGANEAYEQARAQGAGIAGANFATQTANNRQDNQNTMNAISQGVGAYAATQGAGGKDTVNNIDPNTREFSDERLKDLNKRESALSDALGTLGNAPGFSYKYKDPEQLGAAPGQHVSSMAQDLESGPLGSRLVIDTPKGKMVDYKEVMKMTPGAITELNRKVAALEHAFGGGGRKAA